ncbi:TetR family transcriptional regulator [Streptomyces sp. NPDC008092]|uniref:TetR/AcrR family transcriptional regulator n=1 Tax=Streptomyces sp. NPDC008092 TaxID=3364808 RepID=UPI0036ED8CEE
MPETKQERAAVSTGKLLDAAANLVAERGYERTTLAAIGDRAGYTHGLVTARFGSKEGLLWALIERMVVDWSKDHLAYELQGTSGADAIHGLVREMRKSWRAKSQHMKALYVLMFEALLPVPLLNERMRELHRSQRAGLEKTINAAMAAGTVSPDVDSAAVARLIVGALRGAAYQAMLDPREVPIKRALEDVDMLIDALLPPPGAARPQVEG